MDDDFDGVPEDLERKIKVMERDLKETLEDVEFTYFELRKLLGDVSMFERGIGEMLERIRYLDRRSKDPRRRVDEDFGTDR